jgi:hypothetical protein
MVTIENPMSQFCNAVYTENPSGMSVHRSTMHWQIGYWRWLDGKKPFTLYYNHLSHTTPHLTIYQKTSNTFLL